MNCQYIGICGSCTLGFKSYDEQLDYKIQIQQQRFQDIYNQPFDIIKSEPQFFRNRAEFRIWKTYDKENNFVLNYAMNSVEKTVLPIKNCLIVTQAIYDIMPQLIAILQQDVILYDKLFACEFLTSTTSDILVTLIYHKKLDENWINKAKTLESNLGIKILGRSRKQKIVLSDDFIDECLIIKDKQYHFRYKEGGFTQPNQKVNQQMIQWCIDNAILKNDLCELYCGGGNFTIPLSNYFDKVLATEISKTSIKSAKLNCMLNNIDNIKFVRMSSQEFVQARENQRTFRRLEQENIQLKQYDFSTIFVDPPRAGLDQTTVKLAQQFEQIIYISCNPLTLKRDLEVLLQTHWIKKFALFDQFAYSEHIESGVILIKKD